MLLLLLWEIFFKKMHLNIISINKRKTAWPTSAHILISRSVTLASINLELLYLWTIFAFSNVTKAIPRLFSFCLCWSASTFPSSSSSVKYSIPSTWLAPQQWQQGDSLLVLTVVNGLSPVLRRSSSQCSLPIWAARTFLCACFSFTKSNATWTSRTCDSP